MIRGIYASNQGIVGERVGDFASTMLQVNPQGTALLLALSSGMNKEAAVDTVTNWYEDAHQSMRATVTLGNTAAAGVLDVNDSTLFVPGSVILCLETGEQMYCTASNNGMVSVNRGIGGTAPAAVTVGMSLQGIGNAQPEASLLPVAITQQGIARNNYTQIFRNTWAVSGTATAVKYRTGNKTAKNKMDCANYHAEDQERAFIWGTKHVDLMNGKPFRISDGILTQISQYGGVVTTANSAAPGAAPVAGQLSFNDFEDFMRQVFSKNVKGQPNERLCFAGDIAMVQFNKMARLDGTYEIRKEETTFGLSITNLVSQFGTLKMLSHPLMVENPIWQKELYVFHPGGLKKRVLRETFQENYDQNGNRVAGVDADQGAITTESCMCVAAASTMGIYRNISKAVKSS